MNRRRARPHPQQVVQQLALPPREPAWRLDKHTRAVGLRGVAEARAAVLRARQRAAA